MLNLPPAVHTGVKPKMFKPYVLLTDNPKLHVPGQKQSPSTKNSHPVQKTVSKWRVDSRLSQHEINIKVKINSDGFAIFNVPVCI